jgi:cytochrome P450
VFGGGAHRCLGEALARTELEEGLAALTARIPASTERRAAGNPGTRLGTSRWRHARALVDR